MSMSRQRRWEQIFTYVGAAVVFLLIVFPMYGLVLTSIQEEDDIRSPDLDLIPRYILTDHYREVLREGHIVPIREAMGNSLMVSVATAVITLLFAFRPPTR